MDMDIEMDDALETGRELSLEPMPLGDDILQPDEPDEPGEVAEDEPKETSEDSRTLIPSKIHVRGLETLHTNDIKAWVRSTSTSNVDRVEWIDDTSANLCFSSEALARDTLVALSSLPIADATALGAGEVLPAKPVDGRPEISLKLRFAVLSDKKEAGAATRSRYYLLHPEHDPEERRRRRRDQDPRPRRDRRNGSDRRDEDDEVETYDASMYDDAPVASSRRTRRSESPRDRREPRSYTRENRGKELFSGRASGRGRSASPLRDSYGDDGMGTSDPASSARNRQSARSVHGRLSASNKSRELFPSKSGSGKGGERLDQLEAAVGSARLKEEDRPRFAVEPEGGPRRSGGASAFNIRGTANAQQSNDGGFSIKGAASAKELFPGKFGSGGNTGKELFEGGKTKQRRQRAEDLFS